MTHFQAGYNRLLLLSCLFMLISLNTFAQEKKQILFNQESVTVAFSKLEKAFNIRFYYSSEIVNKKELISMPSKLRTLNEILTYLASNYGFEFKSNGNMIAVSKKQKELPAGTTTPRSSAEIRGRAGLFEGNDVVYVGGITIHEQGSSNSAITDGKGNFRINTSSSNPKLLISYIGYQTTEIEAVGNTLLNVNLKEDENTLKEVTVVSNGYQTLAKKNTTGSYSTISTADIERRSSQSLDRILEGSVPYLSSYPCY